MILTQSLVDRARRQIGLFTSLLLIVSAVIIALIIYTMTREKVKQIATLKLIGASDRTIISGMIVQQALALWLIGLATGATLIFSIKDYSRVAWCGPDTCRSWTDRVRGSASFERPRGACRAQGSIGDCAWG